MTPTAAIILAAGAGTRMKSDRAKVLHEIAGRPMINHLLATVDSLKPEKTVVVTAPGMAAVRDAVSPAETALQLTAEGTGHAVMAAADSIGGFDGDILVLYGDTPLITLETLERMLAMRRTDADPAVVVLGFKPLDPAQYGRLVVNEDDLLTAIVEYADATEDERSIGLCNSGVMAIDGKRLAGLLSRLDNANAKGEYYLTDIIAIATGQGWNCGFVVGDETEMLGVNSRAQLAEAEAVLQQRFRNAAMEGGATLIDPQTVWFSHDTRLGRDVTVEPNVFFGTNVVVGDNVWIKANSHLEGCRIDTGASVGPFARLRPGANIGSDAKIGNFVEIKKSDIESGAKISHLSYIGDARVGTEANIGAGTITCNYDGYDKFKTDIGAGAFIGSNTSLVAPVKIGDGAIVGAGSTLTRDVEPDALAIERADEKVKSGWAVRFRNLKNKINKAK